MNPGSPGLLSLAPVDVGDRCFELPQILATTEYAGLVIVLTVTLVAGVSEPVRMFSAGVVGIGDLLLLFMSLEMISMVEIYWRMGKLPVRVPLYIAMGRARPPSDGRFGLPLAMADGRRCRLDRAARCGRAHRALRTSPVSLRSWQPKRGSRSATLTTACCTLPSSASAIFV